MSSFFEHLHFLRPMWLWALLAVPVMFWIWRQRAQQADPWRQVCDPELLAHLTQDSANVLRPRLAPTLTVLALSVIILALAGPAFRQNSSPVMRVQSPLIVAVDLSNAVRATDLKPDRMARVRFKLADLLQSRREGQTALIAYAGDAFTVAPLTDDAAALRDLAASLSPDVMPVPGQHAERAIALALQLLRDGGHTEGDLLLMTGDASAAATEAARKAHAAGLRVSVLGIGSEQGAPIPRSGGGFVTDAAGNMVLPRLNTAGLKALANAGGGRYAPLSVGDADLASLGALQARQDLGEHVKTADSGLAWQDEGPYLLLLLLPIAALAFRKGWLTCLMFGLLLPPLPAQAIDWQDLWQRPDQRAYQALQEGKVEAARSQARDPALAATAAYRAGDFSAAIERFSVGQGADSDYNRGNALAKAGRYNEAIAAYDQALAQEPEMADAKANRKAVQDWLQQQQAQQQSDQGDASKNPSGSDHQQGQSGQQEQKSSDPQNASQDQAENSANEDSGSASQGAKNETSSPSSATSPSANEDASASNPKSEQAQPSQSGDGESEQPRDQADGDKPPEAKPSQSQGKPSSEDELAKPDDETSSEARQQAAEHYAKQMQHAIEQGQEDASQVAATPVMSTEEAEQKQAMEHLLRRVPDDPGGLLRRKFQLEYQRRQQQGESR